MLFDDAPGLKVRALRDGTFAAYWAARHDMVKRGYRPKYFPLWRGKEPNDVDRAMVAEHCNVLQADMITWGRGGIPAGPVEFDGTISSLIYCYTRDKHSTFRKLRYGSRQNYQQFMSRIEKDHGNERIAHLKGRDMVDWHEAWAESGTAMSHALIRMLRGLLTYGLTILEDPECARLSAILSKRRFKMATPRSARLTADMANAVRAKAHEKGLPSLALGQAFQFEGMLRQRDVVGEIVPESEPGPSLAPLWRGRKWQRGIVWSEIDADLILKHVTSKRQKAVEIDLKLAPMVIEELRRAYPGCIDDNGTPHREVLPTFGPIIVYEVTGRPYTHGHYRDVWRGIADECGIPRSVQNRDARAGAISEATDAGATLEDVRHAATHSNIATTQIYSRGSAEKTANVLRLRVEHRNKGQKS